MCTGRGRQHRSCRAHSLRKAWRLARRQPSARPLRLVAAATAGLGLTGALPSIALGLESWGLCEGQKPPNPALPAREGALGA